MSENNLQKGDWSLDLEHGYGLDDIEEMIEESIRAIERTPKGNYVNIVTPGECGDPQDWLIPALMKTIEKDVDRIRYVDECGCGGHVTRVYR